MTKKKNNINIDLGEWTVPTSFDEITLLQWQEIERQDDKSLIAILPILTNHTKDEVMELPTEAIEIMLNKLTFMTQPLPEYKPTNSIKIGDEEYSINYMEKLKTGEYVAFDAALKSDSKNYAAMLAILCRKEGEKFDSKFEAEKYNDRVRLFEQQPISKIFPMISFFLQLYTISKAPSLLYSEIAELGNYILANIQNSTKIGVCRQQYLKWRTKRLLKSLKSKMNT